MKIRYCTPYSLTKNLAEAYNEEMANSQNYDYVAFTDRDTIWLDAKFGHKIAEIVSNHPGNYFTCLTNRTNCKWQRANWNNEGNDIAEHTLQAQAINEIHTTDVSDRTNDQLWSGHLMVCPVAKWKPLEVSGLLGVDNQIHRNAIEQGAKVLLMKGIYIYHWYSNHNGGQKNRDKTHLL